MLLLLLLHFETNYVKLCETAPGALVVCLLKKPGEKYQRRLAMANLVTPRPHRFVVPSLLPPHRPIPLPLFINDD